jgi:hypothetical protein
MFTDLIAGQLTDQETKWSEEADSAGLTWIKKSRNNYNICKFNSCGHIKELHTSSIRTKNILCKECVEIKRHAYASSVGLTFVKRVKDFYGLYKFNLCGHEQEIDFTSVSRNTFKCKACFAYNKHLVANNYGLDFITNTKEYYGLYKFHACGHEQEIQHSAVKINNFTCQQCNGSWSTKRCSLYINTISLQGECFIKVGISKDVKRRIHQYGLPKDASVEIAFEFQFNTGMQASEIETSIIRKFSEFKINDVKHIMTKQGSTECFSVGCLDQMKKFAKAMCCESATTQA